VIILITAPGFFIKHSFSFFKSQYAMIFFLNINRPQNNKKARKEKKRKEKKEDKRRQKETKKHNKCI